MVITDPAGFSTAFFTHSQIALIGAIWLWVAMPETK
jgi:hypothetical protein